MNSDELTELLSGARGRYRSLRCIVRFTSKLPAGRRRGSEHRIVFEHPDKALDEIWAGGPEPQLRDRRGRSGDRWWQEVPGRGVHVQRGGGTKMRIWLGPGAPPDEPLPMEGIRDVGIVDPAVVELLDPDGIVRIGNVDPVLEVLGESEYLGRPVVRARVLFEPQPDEPAIFDTLPFGDGELLVDADRGVILYAHDSAPDGATMTSEVTEIEFDPEIPPEAFEPPSD